MQCMGSTSGTGANAVAPQGKNYAASRAVKDEEVLSTGFVCAMEARRQQIVRLLDLSRPQQVGPQFTFALTRIIRPKFGRPANSAVAETNSFELTDGRHWEEDNLQLSRDRLKDLHMQRRQAQLLLSENRERQSDGPFIRAFRMGTWDSFCVLCGASITSTSSAYQEAARATHSADIRHPTGQTALLTDGRWSRVGCDSCYGSLDPYDKPAQGDSDQSSFFDPDLSATCWYRIDSDKVAPTHGCFIEDQDDFGFPFHAACARWTAAVLAAHGVEPTALATYLGGCLQYGTSSTWAGDRREACPDEVDIAASHEQFPDLKVSQAFVLARPDSLWKSLGGLTARKEPKGDERAAWDWRTAAAGAGGEGQAEGDSGPDDSFDPEGSPAHMFRLRRGTYEGGIAVIPLPLPGLAAEEAATVISRLSMTTPHQLPPHALEAVIASLDAKDAMHLFSTSRSWYLFGRSLGWKVLCKRDGMARVPTEPVEAAIEEYEKRSVDWKRAYFCYESRNFRRIAKNAELLVKRVAIKSRSQ
ncbi:hypothetical protein DFJ73DRAFT_893011 [Zopfochytrium polystomum]|nr:hypothetical protein DFJ73DRAFT_893011 [Zopfochytrium polystomum]